MPDQQTKKLDWSGITIGAKEFIAGILFVITMSGVYYNFYFKQDATKAELDAKITILEKKVEALEARSTNKEDRLRHLEDENLKRDAVEEARNRPTFVPMQRIK